MAYSASLYATKAVRVFGIFTRFNVIDGNVFPQHYMYIDGKIYYEIKNMRNEVNKY